MGALEFIAALVGSLAWPLVVVVLVLLLRVPIGKMLSGEHPVKSLKAGPAGLEVEFDTRLETARQELEDARAERPALPAPQKRPAIEAARDDFMFEMSQLAQIRPEAVVGLSFARLEASLREAVEQSANGGREPRVMSARALGRVAVERGILALSELPALEEVALLRNAVVHGKPTQLDAERALEYARVVQQLLVSIALAQGRTIFHEDEK